MLEGLVMKILVSLVQKLITEEFVSGFLIHTMAAMAAKTDTKLDDQLIADMAKAYGIKPGSA